MRRKHLPSGGPHRAAAAVGATRGPATSTRGGSNRDRLDAMSEVLACVDPSPSLLACVDPSLSEVARDGAPVECSPELSTATPDRACAWGEWVVDSSLPCAFPSAAAHEAPVAEPERAGASWSAAAALEWPSSPAVREQDPRPDVADPWRRAPGPLSDALFAPPPREGAGVVAGLDEVVTELGVLDDLGSLHRSGRIAGPASGIVGLGAELAGEAVTWSGANGALQVVDDYTPSRVPGAVGTGVGLLSAGFNLHHLVTANNAEDGVQASADLAADVAGLALGPLGGLLSAGYGAGQILDGALGISDGLGDLGRTGGLTTDRTLRRYSRVLASRGDPQAESLIAAEDQLARCEDRGAAILGARASAFAHGHSELSHLFTGPARGVVPGLGGPSMRELQEVGCEEEEVRIREACGEDDRRSPPECGAIARHAADVDRLLERIDAGREYVQESYAAAREAWEDDQAAERRRLEEEESFHAWQAGQLDDPSVGLRFRRTGASD